MAAAAKWIPRLLFFMTTILGVSYFLGLIAVDVENDLTIETGKCIKKKQHVYFLKVHKAGSTTTANILFRYGMVHNLSMLTMFKENYCSFPYRTFDDQLPQPKPKRLVNGKYDIYCEHSIYDEEYLMTQLHADTENIAIIREPMSHLRSVFNFYELAWYLRLNNSQDPVSEFLKDPEFYYRKFQFTVQQVGYTKNIVALEFGFREGVDDIDDYIKYLDSRFLVLILERLTESMIVMRRKLCWSIKDVLFDHARQMQYEKKTPSVSEITHHKAYSPYDYAIYNHFRLVMDRAIELQTDDFKGEVKYFENVLSKTRDFCDSVCDRIGKIVKKEFNRRLIKEVLMDELEIEASAWESGFSVDGADCIMMRIGPATYRSAHKVDLVPEICNKTAHKIGSKNGYLRSKSDMNKRQRRDIRSMVKKGVHLTKAMRESIRNLEKLLKIQDYCSDYFKYKLPWSLLKQPVFLSECY